MAGIAGTQFLRLRRKTEKCVELALGKQLQRLQIRIGDPVDVRLRIEPDIGSHQPQQIGRGRLQPDRPAFEIGDTADRPVGEQLVAAHMHAADHRDRQAGADRLDGGHRQAGGEIGLSLCHRLDRASARRQLDKTDFAEAIGAQQFRAGIHRREADGILGDTNSCRVEGGFGRDRARAADRAGGACRRHAADEAAPGLDQCHSRPPVPLMPSIRASAR